MKVDKILSISLLISGISAEVRKRNVEYVTMVTTVNMAYSDYVEGLAGSNPDATSVIANTAPSPAAAAPATTPGTTSTTKSSSGGIRGYLSGLLSDIFNAFGDDDSSSATAPTNAVTNTPIGPTQVNTASISSIPIVPTASPASSTSSGGWVFPFTWPHKSSSGAASATATASSTTGWGTTASGTDSGSEPTASGEDSDMISQIVKYSQMGGGIAYSPYTESGSCKSSDEVKKDMQVLSSFGIIRLYGVDCSGVENVLAAMSSLQSLFVGIYNIDDYNINQDLTTLKSAVENSSRGWDAIHTVSIGNELVNAGKATASAIGSAMQSARNWFKQNASDYSGSLVSVDTLVAVVNNPELCEYSDYLAVNCHPFWDGGVDPSDSGSFLTSQISNLQSVCNGNKDVLITESGWPTKGDTFGKSVPSLSNQLLAIKSIGQTLGNKVLMFTTYNDYWKDGGSYGVEKYWGVFGDPSA